VKIKVITVITVIIESSKQFKMPFPRLCSRCNKRFQPSGVSNRLCPECWKKAQKKAALTRLLLYQKRYEKEKKE